MPPASRLLLVLCLLPWTALHAAPSGAVEGYVQDASGARVARASLKLVAVETNLARQALSDSLGHFQFPEAAPGRYQLTVEAEGFRRTTLREITVLVGQTVALEVALEVGLVSEVVEVSAPIAPLVESEKSATGVAMESAMVKNLPLAARQFIDLAVLTPGVVMQAPGSQAGGFSAAGQRTQSNQFLLDGISNTDPQVNGPLNGFRIADAVQEFAVTTTAAPAEFGRVSGAQVNIITKSGTNAPHGSAFWLNRNDQLAATDFFTNKFAGTKSHLKRQQYGGTVGGPIRHDRTFFFGSWERFWQKDPLPSTAVVPTAAERATVVDPIARGLLSYWPLPTDPSARAGTTNYVGNLPQSTFDNTLLGRIDHAWSEQTRLTGRYLWMGGTNTVGGAVPTSGGRNGAPSTQSLALAATRAFSPGFLGEVRFGYTRNTASFLPQDYGVNAAPLFPGVPGVVDTAQDGLLNSGLPNFFISGYAGIGSATNVPQGRTTNNYELSANGTKIAPLGFSRHTLKFGMQVRREEANRYNNSSSRGAFVFTSFAEFAGTCAACGGRSLLNSATIRTGSTLGNWYRYPWAFYWQDDVKLKPNLTVNFGLRYELSSVMVEKTNRATNFVDGVGAMLAGTNQVLSLNPAVAGPAGFVYTPGPLVLPRGGTTADLNNLAPMFGFAWSPRFGSGPLGDHKTVVRGGFRVGYDDIYYNVPLNQTLNPPWSLTTTQRAGSTQPAAGFPWAVAFNQNVPLVSRTTQGPGAPAIGLIGYNAVDNRARSSYAYNWNLGVQREVSGHLSLDVSYLGSAGRKLGMNLDPNQPFVVLNNASFRGAQSPNEQIFPYPQWARSTITTFQANSIYNGLAASWKARFQGLLNLGGSYTLGHGIDNSSSIFGSDDDTGRPNTRSRLDLERSNSANDQRQRFVTYYVLEVPLGRGHRLLGGASGWVNQVAGGWQVSGITDIFSGQPFTVFANTAKDFSGFDQFNDRPDVLASGPLTLDRGNPDAFFDPAYFGKVGTGVCPGYSTASANTVTGGCAPAGRVGTSPRNGFYGPGIINFDVSASKRFPIGERLALRYRADFFNVANHTNFGIKTGNRSMNSGEFGTLTTVSEHIYGGPRIIQMSLRAEF
jgi:hypothetical protein